MEYEHGRFKDVWTEIEGLPVYARVARNPLPDVPAVALVHGLGLSGTYLMPTAEQLAPHYHVFVPDLPGFGRSGKPPRTLDMPELADALAAWMRAIGLERAALLGNSFGCQIIVECAVRHPERVTRAILQGPTTAPAERSWFWQFVRWRQNPNPNMAPIARQDYRAAGLGRVLRTFQYALEQRVEDQLPKIHIPVLVVRGSRDPICRHGWAEEVTQLLSQGRLVVIPGVYHTLVFTHPLELVRVCRPFLDREAPPPHDMRAVRPPQPTDEASAQVPLAGFDSASGMVRALARYLKGEDFPLLGQWPGWMEPAWEVIGAGVNALPSAVRQQVYIWSGWSEAIEPERLGGVRAERLAQWAVERYPRKRYPAAMIGSSNGALVHLGTALGIPWLPQTVLIPVARSGVDPAEPRQEIEWSRGPAARLLAANPELLLHHMQDPNQDWLMVQRMSYFRVKHLRLPEPYRRFLAETLEPGATIFIVECGLQWPTLQIAERHIFQFGALGGASPEEYYQRSPRVAAFLQRQGSHLHCWDAPTPDGERPEAEWGFEPALRAEVEQFAREHDFRVRRIVFDRPQDISPLVADLYRHWNRSRRLPANRLLVDSFILMEPWWTLRTGAVPFWMVFNTESSADALERYLDTVEPFDEIYLMLFSHGVNSVGLAPISRWRALLQRARRRGEFVGVDEQVYPQDFAVFTRYHARLKQSIAARYPLPRSLTLRELDAFLAEQGERYAVRWME